MIADSSAWIAYLRGTDSTQSIHLRQALSRRTALWMLPVVYAEVLQGARNVHQFVQLQLELDRIPRLVLADPYETGCLGALIYARCRWKGLTIRSPNDCLIAACAIEANEPLLHDDRDFGRIASIEPRLRFA